MAHLIGVAEVQAQCEINIVRGQAIVVEMAGCAI